MAKLQNFEDSQVWQDAMRLARDVYRLSKKFPKEETYGLTSQLHRAAISVPANLAEGFGRNGTKEKTQFYSVAYGSALEAKTFLYLAENLGYCPKQQALIDAINAIQRQINAIKRKINDA